MTQTEGHKKTIQKFIRTDRPSEKKLHWYPSILIVRTCPAQVEEKKNNVYVCH